MTGIRDAILRLLPHPTKPGLRPIGNPGADAPVLVTGNYHLTVRRLEKVLRGHDVWLLVANSRGINVWCAAGGGHFTHHDIIAAIRAARLSTRVNHRQLVLPQLSATGVERKPIFEATGFEARWGPARLEDLPDFLNRHCRLRKAHRTMTFPLWERIEMAIMWAVPMAAIAALVLGSIYGTRVAAIATVAVATEVFGIFFAAPRVPIVGGLRWVTFLGAAAVATAVSALVLHLSGGADNSALLAIAVTTVATVAILSVDIAGTTPWYPGTVNSIANHFHLELVAERCNGSAECIQVCPRNVLLMKSHPRRVQIEHPDDCLLCGACIVQCPEDALRFRFEDGRVTEAATVRTTHLNMLGRRTSTNAEN